MKKKKRLWLFIIPVLLILAGAVFWYIRAGRAERAVSAAISQRTAVVRRGDLSVTLSGSGSVHPSVSTDIKVDVNGTIKESYIEEGRKVKAGDVLLVLNKYDNEISEKKLENSLEQKKLAYQKQLEKYEALTVKAPVAGKVTDIMVEEGDNVNAGKELITITDDSALYTEVTFKDANAEELRQADNVTVHLPDYMTSVSGEIISVQQDGKNAVAVILVKNPGELTEGTNAWCEIECATNSTFQSSSGSLEWYAKKTVYAETSGLVQNINVSRNDYVDKDSVLINLYDEEAEINLKNARIQVEEAEYNIKEFRIDADKYIITAPMDGYLTSVKELLAGDSLKSGDTVATLINIDEMEFTVYIDELDINRVSVGQEVKVTAEAVEDTAVNPVIGKVKNIALVGNSSNGVTVFPVTIVIPGREGLKVGMNVDAEIQIANRENVLLAPLEALQKVGNSYMVWVKETGSANTSDSENPVTNDGNAGRQRRIGGRSESPGQETGDIQFSGRMISEMQGIPIEGNAAGNIRDRIAERARQTGSAVNSYYEGARMVRVEIGQYNENYVEIVSGLEEGDVLVLPMQASSTGRTSIPQAGFYRSPGGFSMPMGGNGSFIGRPGGVRP